LSARFYQLERLKNLSPESLIQGRNRRSESVNQDVVKELLRKLHESPVEYNVIFSGKKSGKVNGLYKWNKWDNG
jgi:hypothetical protein